ncbi:MAG TPA: hypothetical protein VE988_16525, partial [Gemmataceae bacterium]|nr:hypothetical protein [Gemmataceae bacterium]
MNQLLPPPLPELVTLPVTVRSRSTVLKRLASFAVALVAWTWRWLGGAAMCFNFFILSWITSIIAVGWTNRVVQMVVLRCWWWRSPVRDALTFSEFCASLGPDAPSPRPRWFLRNHLRTYVRRPKNGKPPGLFTRIRRILLSPVQSLWLNFKLGIKATFCTYALTGLPCLLMLWSWEQGWINSFHGGYEQAWLGPTMGFLGIFVFVGVMFYVPMAQAHQAATGQARAFFDFHFVWRLVRARITAYVILAMMIGVWSLLLNATRFVVLTETFQANAAPTPEEGLTQFAWYLFKLSLCMFPVYVLLRIFGGLVYQSAVMKALRRGTVTRSEVHPTLRAWLDALQLKIVP